MSSKNSAKPAGVPGLRVRSCSPMGTIRRGGAAFGPAAQTHPLADFSKDQLKAIREEPLLVIEDIVIEAEADAPET